jgi:uncharacterized protein YfeS
MEITEERVNCIRCGASILQRTAEKNKGVCAPCLKSEMYQVATVSPEDDEDDWFDKKEVHPIALEKLKEDFFWDIGDDSGWDTLYDFRDWRLENPKKKATVFLKQLLSDWDVKNRNWDLLDEQKIQTELSNDEFSLNVGDEVIIAVAFGQILLDGRVDEEIKQKALWTVQRQRLDVLANRWGNYAAERKERMQIMQRILEEF